MKFSDSVAIVWDKERVMTNSIQYSMSMFQVVVFSIQFSDVWWDGS